jgi:hypothetical protein
VTLVPAKRLPSIEEWRAMGSPSGLIELAQTQFLTSSGRILDVLDPDPALITIEDIAHALAMLCRFGGHLPRHYSVASHSVHVSRLVPERFAAAGLLHDASEAYVCDVIRPVKIAIRELYRPIEERWMAAIAVALNVPSLAPEAPEVKLADRVALATEYRDLVTWPGETAPNPDGVAPGAFPVEFESAARARRRFLERWEEVRP